MIATGRKKLIAFLYVLLRDELPCGTVETIIRDHVDKLKEKDAVYCNEHLASYAVDVMKRILGDSVSIEREDASLYGWHCGGCEYGFNFEEQGKNRGMPQYCPRCGARRKE